MRPAGCRAAAGVLLLLAASADAAPAAVRLELKPSRRPIEYFVHSQERVVQQGGPDKPSDFTTDVWTHLVRRADDLGKGMLRIDSERLNQRMAVDGKLLERLAFSRDSSSYVCDRAGRRQDGFEAFDPTAAFAPVFPAAPVAPGTSWEIALPPASTFPLPVKVRHQLARLETIRGVPCAVIRSRVKVAGPAPKGDIQVDVDVEMETALALDEGAVLRSHSVTRYLRSAPAPQGGRATLRRVVSRTVRQRSPGEEGPAELR